MPKCLPEKREIGGAGKGQAKKHQSDLPLPQTHPCTHICPHSHIFLVEGLGPMFGEDTVRPFPG